MGYPPFMFSDIINLYSWVGRHCENIVPEPQIYVLGIELHPSFLCLLPPNLTQLFFLLRLKVAERSF